MKKGFRDEFKVIKRKDYVPDFSKIVDFNKLDDPDYHHKNNVISVKYEKSSFDWEKNFGMKNPASWEVYSFLNKPGLYFIKNPFYAFGQRYWIIRCLQDYTKKPSKLNIDAHDLIKTEEDWWEYCHKTQNEKEAQVLEKLRWATFGYHHNWDTKEYSESSKCKFPDDLNSLCKYLAEELGFTNFNAEAAIINMYHFGSYLSGHTDHSEVNVKAPLFSFSFGQSAIFLIGGKSLEDVALPVLLESGDIIIMSGESRLCYHGIPKIIPSEKQPWNLSEEQCSDNFNSNFYCKEVLDIVSNNEVWKPFEQYVKKSRINMNVRQVLLPEQKSLVS